MIHKNLEELLVRLGFAKETTAEKSGRGAATVFLAPSGQAASVYLTRGDESLILDKVIQLEIDPETAIVTTQRKERYGVVLGEIRALRIVPDGK